MKKLLVLLFLFLIPQLLSSQENSRLFSEAVQTNFSKFKRQSNQAYKEGNFEKGQFLFDSLVQNQLIGSKFNDYSLKRVSSKKLKISKIKKPIFLITYASWCVPSKGEIPAINKLAKQYKDVEFIVIVWGKKKEAKKFAKKFSSNVEVCYADKNYKNDNEIVSNMKETLGFPTSYMIDSNLQVVNIKRGSTSIPYKTPLKKALEENYNVFNLKITELINHQNQFNGMVISN